MFFALLLIGLVEGGLRALVGDSPTHERLLGALALLAGITVTGVVVAYLCRPTRAPDEPTFRADPNDQVQA